MNLGFPISMKCLNTLLIVIIPFVSAIVALVSFLYARQNNKRAEMLFGSQIRPLIQEQPTGLFFDKTLNSTKTMYEIVNYSGFDAFDITYDLKYGTNDWIIQWLQAETNRLQQLAQRSPQEEQCLKELLKKPWFIAKIKSGERVCRATSGSLSLDNVCAQREGYDVLTRVTWKNEKGHKFDRIRKFRLLCTKVDSGMSFTFMPEGIVAQDE